MERNQRKRLDIEEGATITPNSEQVKAIAEKIIAKFPFELYTKERNVITKAIISELTEALSQQPTVTALDDLWREIFAQREEILKAFIAKYGCDPDRILQVIGKSLEGEEWHVKLLPSPYPLPISASAEELAEPTLSAGEIRKQWGYEGKPKQWQEGFDCALREINIFQLQEPLRKREAETAELRKELEEAQAIADDHAIYAGEVKAENARLTAEVERLKQKG